MPFKIKTPDTYTDKTKATVLVPGEERSLSLKPGDGLLYKGCERPHWRDPMPGKTKKVFGKKVELYYHQIFFHYVLLMDNVLPLAHGIEHDEKLHSLFEYPTYQYQIKDWEFKKKGLLKRLKEEKFMRTSLQTFETDRQTNKKTYLHYFQNLIKDELFEFCQEAQVTCSMTDVWSVVIRKEIIKLSTTIGVGVSLVFST